MDRYSFDQSEADSFYAILHESGYAGPVVIDATDTDVHIAAAYISASWYAACALRGSRKLSCVIV